MGITSRWVIGFAALVALAACGGSGGSSKSPVSSPGTASTSSTGSTSSTRSSSRASTTGNASACSLVTPSDAASITGESDLTQSAPAGTAVCIYTKPGQPVAAGNGLYVAIYPVPVVSSQTLQSLLRERITGTGDFRSISGVGDSAYEQTSTGGAGLVFAKGRQVVIIGATSGTKTGNDMLSPIESVAKQAAGQL